MKIICVGRNYAAHARELNNAVEDSPVIFMKPETALITGRQPFFIPSFSEDVHYETELVVRISRLGKNIQERFANRYYDAVSLGIDFTARDLQANLKAKGLPWELAKAFDGSAACGKFIPVNEMTKDLRNLHFRMNLNGEEKQIGHTADMIFPIDRIIAFVSSYFTLKIGDLIYTGTPAGVGRVKEGDVIEAWLEELKILQLKVK